jgi:competence CoiA-like predicted nuclease
MARDRSEYGREYRQRNKERIKKRQHEYYQKNGEKIRARNRKWDKEQRAKRNKYRNKRGETIKTWYYDNIEKLCCLDCGLPFKEKTYVADFHHVSGNRKYGKTRSMFTFVMRFSYNNIVEELNKGIFLCSNCHRGRHRG